MPKGQYARRKKVLTDSAVSMIDETNRTLTLENQDLRNQVVKLEQEILELHRELLAVYRRISST